MASGVAARNGTTSHTIPFGFTSTSGNLLAFFIFGAVTHTGPGAPWTEQEQPVASGELSLFTATSSGQSSITITHNGSNYPACWVCYEWYAGSTLTATVSANANSDTFPALTGLPGTEQVAVAAFGRTAPSSTETNASAAWGGSLVEDADLFSAFAVTDGAFLTVAHQLNVTATSFTPTLTPTYSGTWATPDREKVVAAFNVTQPPAGDTTPPTVPTGLTSTAIGSTTVDLSWSASTDDVAVTGYEIQVIGP
jgi:hypothetical protein